MKLHDLDLDPLMWEAVQGVPEVGRVDMEEAAEPDNVFALTPA